VATPLFAHGLSSRFGVRIHKTLKVTPAMAAGVSATLQTMEDIAERIEAKRPQPGKRGPGAPEAIRTPHPQIRSQEKYLAISTA
jgi:hypothetical protein